MFDCPFLIFYFQTFLFFMFACMCDWLSTIYFTYISDISL